MGIAWSSDFSYRYFRSILQTARSNFGFHLFSEVPDVMNTSGQRKLFLRHDVDIDLTRALQMAKIEKELGICSTYMVMLNSPLLYNIEDKLSREIIQQLISMGHEIGLHFDLADDQRNQSLSITSIESKIYSDLKQLENIIQLPVQSISFHRPLPQFMRGPLKIAGRVNAYSQELMGWYLSDSAGNWREGEPLPKLLNPTGDLLQLLIHPIWWGDEHITSADRLEDYFTTTTQGWSPQRTQTFDTALSQQLGVRRSGKKNNLEVSHIPESGKFNTDATALIQRIESHEKFGSNNLNNWIFEHLDVVKGVSILDLGCGTGKQTLPMTQIIGETGHVVSFDASQKALESLFHSAEQLEIDNRIALKCGNLDDLDKYLDDQLFDRVLGSFSLYYAENPQVVFETVHRHLNSDGILFFCGPAKDNNSELKLFHNALLKEQTPVENRSATFMQETGQLLARALFAKVEVYTFQNPLQFVSAGTLYDYWSSYNLYNEKIDAAFKEAAVKHFHTHSKFETVKRVIGVKAVK